MAHELKGREIFAVGTWNGIEFVEADLDDIVANFEKLKEKHYVPLKFGHDPDHAKDKDKMGQPAIGWISRVFKEGQKLYADFADMPRTVFEAIKNKLYRTVSIEVLFNVDSDGNRFNHVLDAVALLGADQPAVSGLSDLNALLATRTSFAGGHRVAFETIAGTSKKFDSKPEVEMDKKEIQDLIKEQMEPVLAENVKLTKALKESDEKLVKLETEKADGEKKVKAEAIKLSREKVVAVLDAAVRAKTLTPATREVYEKQIGLADDERVVNIDVEEIRTMFSVKKVDDEQQGKHGEKDKIDLDNPDTEMLRLTREYQHKHGEDNFMVAFSRVADANQELHKAYLDSNGEKTS